MAKGPSFTRCVKVLTKDLQDPILRAIATQLTQDLHKRVRKTTDTKFAQVRDDVTTVAKQIIAAERLANAKARRNALLQLSRNMDLRMEGTAIAGSVGEVDRAVAPIAAATEGRLAWNTPNARNSVYERINGKHAEMQGKLNGILEKHGKVDEFYSGALDDQLVRGFRNEPVPPKTQALVQDLRKMFKGMVDELNANGADINFRDDWFGRQIHDYEAIVRWAVRDLPWKQRIGRYSGFGSDAARNNYVYKKWRDWMLPRLDFNETFGTATPSAQLVEDFMLGAWRGISTGIHGRFDKVTPNLTQLLSENRNIGPLARKISERRLFHFKDAVSAKEQVELFGAGDVHTSITSSLESHARTYAMLSKFGPNPKAGFDSLVKWSLKQSRNAGEVDAIEKARRQADVMWGRLSGDLDSSTNRTAEDWTNGIMAVQVMARLGASIFTAFSDKAFMYNKAVMLGVGQLDALRMALTITRTPEAKAFARSLGAGLDAANQEALLRYSTVDGLRGFLDKAQNKFFKYNLQNLWNSTNRQLFVHWTAGLLGAYKGKAFNQLSPELIAHMRQFGLGDFEWSMMSQVIRDHGDGHLRFHPSDLESIPDIQFQPEALRRIRARGVTSRVKAPALQREAKLVKADLIDRSYAFVIGQMNDAVLQPDATVRRWLLGGSQKGTAEWVLRSLAGQFWSFSMATITRTKADVLLYKNIHGVRSAWGQAARLIAYSTVTAIVGDIMKSIVLNREPEPITIMKEGGIGINMPYITRMMAKGGGLGIYADLLFTEYDTGYKSPATAIPGPGVGEVLDLFVALHSAVRTGGTEGPVEGLRDLGTYASKSLRRNLPFGNLPFVKPILDTLIWQNVISFFDEDYMDSIRQFARPPLIGQ